MGEPIIFNSPLIVVADGPIDNVYYYILSGRRQLCRNSAGKWHCIFKDYTNQIVYVGSSIDGVSWTKEVAYTADDNLYGGSICVDSDDNIHIIISDCPTWDGGHQMNKVVWRQKTSEGWQNAETIHTVDTGFEPSNFTIAVDSNDDVHTMWDENSALRIRYCKRTSGNWGSVETVRYNSTHHSDFPCLALDSSNTVHAVYRGGTGSNSRSDIYYRARNGSWGSETKIVDGDTYGVSLGRPCICIDSSDILHVAWAEVGGSAVSENREVYYMYNDGSWSTPVKIEEDYPWNYPEEISITINDAGTLYISTGSHTDGVRWWYKTVGESWTREVPVPIGSGGGSYMYANYPIVSGDKPNILPDSAAMLLYKRNLVGTESSILFFQPPYKPIIFHSRADGKPVVFHSRT